MSDFSVFMVALVLFFYIYIIEIISLRTNTINAISAVCVQEDYRRHHRTDNQSRAHKQHTYDKTRTPGNTTLIKDIF